MYHTIQAIENCFFQTDLRMIKYKCKILYFFALHSCIFLVWVECPVKKRVFLSCFCILILIIITAAPVLAATLSSTVTCPSTCSCLLPEEAKKAGSPGYCNNQQKVCGSDTGTIKRYCYEKPVITTTTVAPQKCASGCTCLSSADGKGKGLLYCNGKQTVCG